MKKDTMPQVAEFWNNVASEFDAIYTGNKSPVGRALDKWLRKDMYQRFDWVMESCGDAKATHICAVGCGSGRFSNELARRGATVTGVTRPGNGKAGECARAQRRHRGSLRVHQRRRDRLDGPAYLRHHHCDRFLGLHSRSAGASAPHSIVHQHERDVSFRVAALVDVAHADSQSAPANAWLPGLLFPPRTSLRDAAPNRLRSAKLQDHRQTILRGRAPGLAAVPALVFWISLAVPIYAYFGYPLALGAVGSFDPASGSRGADSSPRFASIPAYREAAVIERKIGNSLALEYPPERLEIVVACDGSPDETPKLAQKFAEKIGDPRRLRVLNFPVNRGKIGVLNASVPELTGEIVVFSRRRRHAVSRFRRAADFEFRRLFGGRCQRKIHRGQSRRRGDRPQ